MPLNHLLDTHLLDDGMVVDLAAANAIQILWELRDDRSRSALALSRLGKRRSLLACMFHFANAAG